MNLLLSLLPILFAAATTGAPPAYTLEQYMAIRRANGPSFSPGADRVVFSSNASGDWQLWLTPTSRWEPRQLTHFSGGATGLWSPDAETILAMADRNGDQKFQLFTIAAGSGETTQVTLEPEAMHRLGGWMPDGKSIFYTSNARDARYFDCYVMDLATRHAERVSDTAALLRAMAVSHDGRLLAAEDRRTPADNDILIVDVRARTARVITPHQGPALFSVIGFSADDRTLYCRTNVEGEFMAIHAIDLASGVRRPLISIPHDIDNAIVDRQGERIAFAENLDGFARPAVWDVRAGRRLPLPDLPAGINTPEEFSSDGSKLAITVSTPVHDDEVWVVDLAARRAARVTYSPQGGVAEDSYALPSTIRYKSFDGRSIPALLFVPKGASPARRAPVIVSVHGGPEDQERPYLTNYYQFLVARGYAVLAPNVRGSTGYGKSYVALDNGALRWDALKDVAAAVRWVRSQPRLDGSKVACWGASYGGFITLAMLVHYPELFRAGVDFYGPADLATFLARTAAYRRPQRIAEYGDPARDSTFMATISPARHANRIQRPLLVIQGANDPIVPPAESEDIVRLVRERGGVAEYLLFPDEGHGLGKEPNYVKAYETMLDFLRRHMPPPDALAGSTR
jgi:dipeptidyl aminopeptidase/acylaminoacyl peptidase